MTGRLLAIPYDWTRNPEKNGKLLDYLVAHPRFFSNAMEPDVIYAEAAKWLTDPVNFFWEIWDGGEFVGIILLHRVTPTVDGVIHFVIFDGAKYIFAVTTLLENFLGHIFETFDLQRLSAEVPEHHGKFARYLRESLGFKYEGEAQFAASPLASFLMEPGSCRFHMPNAPEWMAKQGSRRESAHFDGRRFRDVLLLRLLRSEYYARSQASSLATRETESLDVVGQQASAVRPVHPTGSPGVEGPEHQPPLVAVRTGDGTGEPIR